jgi:hypothetical protein
VSTQTMERHRVEPPPGRGPIARLRQQVVRPGRGILIVGAVIVATLAFVVYGQLTRVQVEEDSAAKTGQLTTLADPLAALCANDPVVRARLGDDVCFTAQQVVAMPPATPVPGADGAPGAAGRGVVATVIRADGHLTVTFSDGAVIDAGPVVGKAGVNGRGITNSQIVGGALVLTFSDGTAQNLGPVVGERGAAGIAGTAGADGAPGLDGRGIQSTAIVGGRLVITYTDQTTEDAGEVPAGPAGPAGRDAELPQTVTRTYPDGTAETCTRNGGTPQAPIYDCTERQ